MARVKGSAAERELFKLLGAELGIVVQRNLSQTRGGGCDTIDIKGWALECKRQETLNLSAWWCQTLEQSDIDHKPVLFFRQNRYPWSAMMKLSDILKVCSNDANENIWNKPNTVIMDFQTACLIIRESL